MSTVQDTINDIRKRLNYLESQSSSSENIPVASPITPRITRIPYIFKPYAQHAFFATFETKDGDKRIFNGFFFI